MKSKHHIVGYVVAGALALSPAALHALEFTPEILETKTEDGFTTREIVLKDDAARVVYCPPADWRVESGARHLRFFPRTVSLADLTIEAERVPMRRTLEEADIDRCRAWLKSSVPSESSGIAMEADETNPGSVANCPTLGMTVAYTNGGVRYRKRTIFAFTPNLEIRFTTVARVADFDRLYPAVRASLFSWRWELGK